MTKVKYATCAAATAQVRVSMSVEGFSLEVFGEDTCRTKPQVREEKIAKQSSVMLWESGFIPFGAVAPTSAVAAEVDGAGRRPTQCKTRLGFEYDNPNVVTLIAFAAIAPSHFEVDAELEWGGEAAAAPDTEPPRIACPPTVLLVAGAGTAGGCPICLEANRAGTLGRADATMRLKHAPGRLRNGTHVLVTTVEGGGTATPASIVASDNWNVPKVEATLVDGTVITPETPFAPDARVGVTFTATDMVGRTASCSTTAVTFTTRKGSALASWNEWKTQSRLAQGLHTTDTAVLGVGDSSAAAGVTEVRGEGNSAPLVFYTSETIKTKGPCRASCGTTNNDLAGCNECADLFEAAAGNVTFTLRAPSLGSGEWVISDKFTGATFGQLSNRSAGLHTVTMVAVDAYGAHAKVSTLC